MPVRPATGSPVPAPHSHLGSAWGLALGLLLAGAAAAAPEFSPPRYRTPLHLPEVEGYLTLKCDFHIHTVFSDGLVWPTVRAEEAWREGLDVIAITDHLEYQPHRQDLPVNHNRAYELARGAGEDLNLLVVHGSEITRSMPPGHLNALFLEDSSPLATETWTDAIDAAHRQAAFIFWNHPGWERQLTDGVVRWYPEHTALLEAGQLHGIEVVNDRAYYPEAHRWALEKNLTLLSNSDIHEPIHLEFQPHLGDHRPMTLVFATERSLAAVREALFARRTAVYADRRLIGEERFLRPIFEKSLSFDRSQVALTGKRPVLVQITNHSDLDFDLEAVQPPEAFSAPSSLTLLAGRTVLCELRGRNLDQPAAPALRYRVSNLLVAPETPLEVVLPLAVTTAAEPVR